MVERYVLLELAQGNLSLHLPAPRGRGNKITSRMHACMHEEGGPPIRSQTSDRNLSCVPTQSARMTSTILRWSGCKVASACISYITDFVAYELTFMAFQQSWPGAMAKEGPDLPAQELHWDDGR